MSSFIQPKITVDSITDNVSRITVEPLERGFGDTLGNSMRRVLLSSLQGAAVESIKIDGVQHEFSSLEGAYEDVTDIVLNTKKLVFSSEGVTDHATATINIEGPCEVKGGDFMIPAGFNLVNPDLVLCHLSDGARLIMELNIGVGRGYVAGVERESKNDPIGIIYIDSLYSPVARCAKSVRPCRVGQHTDYDALVLEVETNGAISPVNAVVEAAHIMNEYMGAFMGLDKLQSEKLATDTIFEQTEEEPDNNVTDIPVEDMNLSVRSYNCLKRAEINNLNELLGYSEHDLLHLRNFGAKSVEEVKNKLEEMGYSLKNA